MKKNITYYTRVRPCAMMTTLKKEGKVSLYITGASRLMSKWMVKNISLQYFLHQRSKGKGGAHKVLVLTPSLPWCIQLYFQKYLCSIGNTVKFSKGITLLIFYIIPEERTPAKQFKSIEEGNLQIWIDNFLDLWTDCKDTPVNISCLLPLLSSYTPDCNKASKS